MPGNKDFKMKVLFVYRNFSHLKSTRMLSNTLQKKGLNIEIIPVECLYQKDDVAKYLCEYALLFLSLGGRDINRIINCLNGCKARPLTISLFPGIVVDEQLEAYVTRLKCDLVLLNSKKDAELYKLICRLGGIADNGYLLGPAWYEANKNDQCRPRSYVYIDQIKIPNRKKQRVALLNMLAMLANRHKDASIIIKPRNDQINHPLSLNNLLNQIEVPKNLTVSFDPVEDILSSAEGLLTISSSASIEGILMGKKVFIVQNFSSRKSYSHFFDNSGLQCSLETLNLYQKQEVNPVWLKKNVENPCENVENLVDDIMQRKIQKSEVKLGAYSFLKLSICLWLLNTSDSIGKFLRLYRAGKYILR